MHGSCFGAGTQWVLQLGSQIWCEILKILTCMKSSWICPEETVHIWLINPNPGETNCSVVKVWSAGSQTADLQMHLCAVPSFRAHTAPWFLESSKFRQSDCYTSGFQSKRCRKMPGRVVDLGEFICLHYTCFSNLIALFFEKLKPTWTACCIASPDAHNTKCTQILQIEQTHRFICSMDWPAIALLQLHIGPEQ